MNSKIPWDEYSNLTRERTPAPPTRKIEISEPSIGAQLCEFVARHWILATLAVLGFLAAVAAAIAILTK
jgi:hypothetical protein